MNSALPIATLFCTRTKDFRKALLTFWFLVLLAPLLFAQDTLMGLTYTGGPTNDGTAFKMLSTGTGFSVTTAFNTTTGINPYDNLVKGSDCNFYGTTNNYGSLGYGTIFKMTSSGKLTVIKSFDNATTGSYPIGSLVQASDGAFYGMTSSGGKYAGYGTIFKITSGGTLTVIKNLDNNTTGGRPEGNLVQGPDGLLYGMTYQGGVIGYGTIFKITTGGTMTILKNLDLYNTGGYPYGSLVQGSDGAFYGMTNAGGSHGQGTIFKITSNGTLTVIKNLDGYTNGGAPHGSLIKATDGAFYGMTHQGGSSSYGTIFKITPGGTFTVLKNLDYYTTGGNPVGDLVQGTNGVLYGMTPAGGTHGGGTIFKISTTGSGFTVLRNLTTATDGGAPQGSLIIKQPNPLATPQSVTTAKNTVKKIQLTATGGTPLTYAVSTKPLHGTATIVKDTLTYTPAIGYVGTDSLYFTATRDCQKSATAKIKITVTASALTVSNGSSEGFAIAEHGALQVSAWPNPSTTSFTLTVRSGTAEPVLLRVVNALGKLVENRSGITATGTLQIGGSYRPGLYIAEVVQGNQRVVVKLLKQ